MEDRKDGTEDQDGNPREKKFACPVCGKVMSEEYLPDKKGFIDERLYYFDDFRVIAGTVLECDFYHVYDEEEDTMLEEPNPAPNYREYVYLMNFPNPCFVFKALKGFPHTLQYGITFWNWNTMVITDLDMDFSKLVGFQSMVAKGIRGLTYTPKVEYVSWDQTFERMYEQIERFAPAQKENRKQELCTLDWGNDEWKLFHTFKHNIRQKVTPTLRKIKVRYETYSPWMKTLKDHCTIHTEFYPEGRETYMGYCFLFSTDHKSSLGAKGTREILELMSQHSTVQYNQMMKLVNTPTLNKRLRDLLIFGLISHHLERVETRREWYELTEKGKQALKYLRALVELTVSSS